MLATNKEETKTKHRINDDNDNENDLDLTLFPSVSSNNRMSMEPMNFCLAYLSAEFFMAV